MLTGTIFAINVRQLDHMSFDNIWLEVRRQLTLERKRDGLKDGTNLSLKNYRSLEERFFRIYAHLLSPNSRTKIVEAL